MKPRPPKRKPLSNPAARPAIRGGDPARIAILRGVESMADALRPTLGPLGGPVLIAGSTGSVAPELLSRGGLIARRTVEIAGPFENMGAMLLRQMAWRMHERFGDGVATAAVIAHRLLAELTVPVAAGVNPQAIRASLDRALPNLLDELRRMARPLDGRGQLRGVLGGDALEPEAVEAVAEALDALGPDARIRVHDGHRTGVAVEYLEGASWNGRCASRALMGGEETGRLTDARILVTDLSIRSAQELIPAVEACLRAGACSLLVIAPEIGDAAIGLLAVNRERGVLSGALAVQPQGVGPHQIELLEEIALVTGGRLVSARTGDRIADVRSGDLGFARQVWVMASMFGVVNPGGKPAARRARLRRLHTELNAPGLAPADRARLESRIGNLAGVAAEIRAGAATDAERAALKERIEATIALGRAALRDGVVPGGGRALLELADRVPCAGHGGDAERAAQRALRRALAEPMAVIARIGGKEPSPVLAGAAERGASATFDAVAGEWVDAWSAGLLDPAGVLAGALESAVSMAGIAITTDVLIHRREPEIAREP